MELKKMNFKIFSTREVPIKGSVFAGCFKINANNIWFSVALY